MKPMTFVLLFSLIFAATAAYELRRRGLLTREVLELYLAAETEEEKTMTPAAEPVGLAATIQEKKQELREETKDLEQLSERLQAQRKELDKDRILLERRIRELRAGQAAVPGSERRLGRAAMSEEMLQLIKMYESMPPEDAADVLDNMPDQTVAEILLQIRSRQAAQIMGSLDKNKAVQVSRLLSAEDESEEPPKQETVETR